jgi:hypothetical protein
MKMSIAANKTRTIEITYTTDQSIVFENPVVEASLEAKNHSLFCKDFLPNQYTVLAINQKQKEIGEIDLWKQFDSESGLYLYAIQLNYKAPKGCRYDFKNLTIKHRTLVDEGKTQDVFTTVSVLDKNFEDSNVFRNGFLNLKTDNQALYQKRAGLCKITKNINPSDQYIWYSQKCSALNEQIGPSFTSNRIRFYFGQTFFENYFETNHKLIAPHFHLQVLPQNY